MFWDRNIKARMPNYIFQCGLATLSLLAILLIENGVFGAAIVVAVASTVFIVFVIPDSIAATPQRIIGGHLVAVVLGGLTSAILIIPAITTGLEQSLILLDFIAAISVGISILLMVLTNTEHPPAAGTVFGLVIDGWTWSAVLFILSSALLLSFLRFALRRRMINLL